MGIYLLGPECVVAGTRASYRVKVHWTTAPKISGVLPRARLILWARPRATEATKAKTRRQRWRRLTQARSDSRGEATLAFRAPGRPGELELRLQARAPLGRHEVTKTITVVAGGEVLLTTDKPLYRPGQTLHVRALALRRVDRQPLSRQMLTFAVEDPKGTRIHEQRVRTSAFGVASTSLPLAAEVGLGRYRITAAFGEEPAAERKVRVSRYRLAPFELRIVTQHKAYRPNQRLVAEVRGRYFHGKPLSGAKVRLEVHSRLCPPTRSGRCEKRGEVFVLRTNTQGRAKIELPLRTSRRALTFRKGWLDLRAEVVDGAGERRRAFRRLPFTPVTLRSTLLSPQGGMSSRHGRKNRLVVLAADASGAPLKGAKVTLTIDKRAHSGKTDALGSADFALTGPFTAPCHVLSETPRWRRGRYRRRSLGMGVSVGVEIRSALGHTLRRQHCVPLAKHSFELHLPSFVSQAGAPLQAVIYANRAADGELAYLDIIKGSQTVRQGRARFHGGQARFSVPVPDKVDGLVVLRGYRLGKEDARSSRRRALWIEPRATLRIQTRLDQPEYRPGAEATLSLHVTRSDTGKGVAAALGLRAVDQALLALVEPNPDAEPLLFAFAQWAKSQANKLALAPGNKSLGRWILQRHQALRRRALGLYLASLAPPTFAVWETAPWEARRTRWETQRDAIVDAVKAGVRTMSLGKRLSKTKWTFHPRCVSKLVAAGKLKKGSAVDPWARYVHGTRLRELDPALDFEQLAKAAAQEKVDRVYALIERVKHKLPRLRVRGFTSDDWPTILPANLFARLRRIPNTQRHTFVDPWGRRLRIRFHRRRLLHTDGWHSQYEVISTGPDGRVGGGDDVRHHHHDERAFGKGGLVGALCKTGHCSPRCQAHGGCASFGYGCGCGHLGARYGRAPRVVAGRASVRGARGSHGPGAAPRTRSRFPETLLWRPEVLTDSKGRATVKVPLADSITRWRIVADASTRDGLFGRTALDLKVSQPFYVDVDLPRKLTVGDRLSLPLKVANHDRRRLTITLRVRKAPWFLLQGKATRTLNLPPGAVSAVAIPIEVRQAGLQSLHIEGRAVDAAGKARHADAVERSTEVLPDGELISQSRSGLLELLRRPGSRAHTVTLPPAMLASSGSLRLRLEPGPVTSTMEGLEGLLRRPYGCFEQTSATVFPNLLVLDYLQRSKKAKPKIARRARRYLSEGYQRLLTFEVAGGGFSWFGRAPANQVLTAYGLVEFSLLSKLRQVDRKLIERTRRWLLDRQQKDGSWLPDKQNLNDGLTNRKAGNRARVTAYIAASLADSGYRGKALDRALSYLKAHVDQEKDPYSLALLAHAWLARPRSPHLGALLERLWALRSERRGRTVFAGPKATLTHGAGRSGDVETTALAALVFARTAGRSKEALQLQVSLAKARGRHGAWATTQATILALRALLAGKHLGALPRGKIEVLVDGALRRSLRLRGKDRIRLVDLGADARSPGQRRVTLRYRGRGRVAYRLEAFHWQPRGLRPTPKAPTLRLTARFAKTRLVVGESLAVSVVLHNIGKTAVKMPLVSVPLPPGFDLAPRLTDKLLAAKLASKIEQRGNQLVFYLEHLAPKAKARFPLVMRSRFPLRVRMPPATAYEYYRPENRAEAAPQLLQVRPAPERKKPAPKKVAARAPADKALDRLLRHVH